SWWTWCAHCHQRSWALRCCTACIWASTGRVRRCRPCCCLFGSGHSFWMRALRVWRAPTDSGSGCPEPGSNLEVGG
ncbi:unnamed protein product, partial [Effrenium voratum]